MGVVKWVLWVMVYTALLFQISIAFVYLASNICAEPIELFGFPVCPMLQDSVSVCLNGTFFCE